MNPFTSHFFDPRTSTDCKFSQSGLILSDFCSCPISLSLSEILYHCAQHIQRNVSWSKSLSPDMRSRLHYESWDVFKWLLPPFDLFLQMLVYQRADLLEKVQMSFILRLKSPDIWVLREDRRPVKRYHPIYLSVCGPGRVSGEAAFCAWCMQLSPWLSDTSLERLGSIIHLCEGEQVERHCWAAE